jgi:hypothetical protein
MTDHPVLKKLQLKDQNPLLILNAPAEYKPVLASVTAPYDSTPKQKYSFIQLFVHSKAEIEHYAGQVIDALDGDGLLWVVYPKKSSKKYTSDISRDSGWDIFGKHSFEPVSQIAIDDDWSALRFRYVDYIKDLKRRIALSQKGQDRIRSKSR